MKTIKYFIVAMCLALLGLQACMTEETMNADPGITQKGELTAVQFAATNGAATRTINGGDDWVTGDSIGIYTAALNDAISLSYADNRLFRVDDASQTPSPLVPGDPAETIYYLETTPVWFTAYYPYLRSGSGGIMNYIYPVNVGNQQDTTHIDLLYVMDDNNSAGHVRSTTTPPVTLTFKHQLSKLVLNVKRDPLAGLSVPLSALINDMSTTADFDLATGTLGNLSAPQPLRMVTLEVPATGYDSSYQAIIIPHVIDPGKEMVRILTERRQFTWTIPTGVLPGDEFKPGFKYTFNLTLMGDASVQFDAEISPWSDWTVPAGVDITPDTTQAESGTVFSKPVGYIAAERRYTDTLQTVFIHPTTPFRIGTLTAMTYAPAPPTPAHKVSITSAYLLGETEVTNAQFARFLNAAGATVSGTNILVPDINALVPLVPAGTNTNIIGTYTAANISYSAPVWTAVAANAKLPAINVNWYGAMAYATWAGGRLPTEAEWEYAARGGLASAIDYIDGPTATVPGASNNGSNMALYAWAGGKAGPQDVRQLAPNGYGLYDLFGNAWEWCFDRVLTNPEGYPADGQAATNPEGTNTAVTTGTYAIVRGGGFNTAAPLIRLYIGMRATNNTLGNIANSNGFRVAFPLK